MGKYNRERIPLYKKIPEAKDIIRLTDLKENDEIFDFATPVIIKQYKEARKDRPNDKKFSFSEFVKEKPNPKPIITTTITEIPVTANLNLVLLLQSQQLSLSIQY